MFVIPLKCPKCTNHTTQLELEPNLFIDRCEKCNGTWLGKGELAQLASSSTDLPGVKEAIANGETMPYCCPACTQQNKKHSLIEIAYSADDSLEVMVDFCKECEGLWLDNAEIGSVRTVLKKMRIQQKLKTVNSLKK